MPVHTGADQRHPKDRLVGQLANRSTLGGAHPLHLLLKTVAVKVVTMSFVSKATSTPFTRTTAEPPWPSPPATVPSAD